MISNTFILTDDENFESASDVDQQEEDIAEGGHPRDEYASSLSQQREGILWNRPGLSKSDGHQDTTKERTMFPSPDLMYSAERDSSKKHLSEIPHGVLPMMLQTQSSMPLAAGHLQTFDFPSAHSQQFLKLGAPLLFDPGQLTLKPEGAGRLLPSFLAVENRGLPSQSITSPSPFMFHLSQHMLASQVRFLHHTYMYLNGHHNCCWLLKWYIHRCHQPKRNGFALLIKANKYP